MLKGHSVPFVEAQRRAWRYFENAISVYTELLFTPTGLPVVQALAMMVRYLTSNYQLVLTLLVRHNVIY
jgi:hypothetical protein